MPRSGTAPTARPRKRPVKQGAKCLRRNVAWITRPVEIRSAPFARRRTLPPSATRGAGVEIQSIARAPSLRGLPTASRRVRRLRFQIDQTIDDGGRLRSAIDVVADKYERQRPPVGVHFAMQQQAVQLVQTTVNIADGVSERHCNSSAVFGRRSFLMMAIFRHSRSVHVHQKMGTLARWGRLVFCEEPTLSR